MVPSVGFEPTSVRLRVCDNNRYTTKALRILTVETIHYASFPGLSMSFGPGWIRTNSNNQQWLGWWAPLPQTLRRQINSLVRLLVPPHPNQDWHHSRESNSNLLPEKQRS